VSGQYGERDVACPPHRALTGARGGQVHDKNREEVLRMLAGARGSVVSLTLTRFAPHRASRQPRAPAADARGGVRGRHRPLDVSDGRPSTPSTPLHGRRVQVCLRRNFAIGAPPAAGVDVSGEWDAAALANGAAVAFTLDRPFALLVRDAASGAVAPATPATPAGPGRAAPPHRALTRTVALLISPRSALQVLLSAVVTHPDCPHAHAHDAKAPPAAPDLPQRRRLTGRDASASGGGTEVLEMRQAEQALESARAALEASRSSGSGARCSAASAAEGAPSPARVEYGAPAAVTAPTPAPRSPRSAAPAGAAPSAWRTRWHAFPLAPRHVSSPCGVSD
jgi:hypothetical protein